MSLVFLLGIFGYSMLGALIPIFPVEGAVIGAAAKYGDGIGPTLVVPLAAALGTMVGKLQVYAIARGGRSLGGKWMQRRMQRRAGAALAKAAEITDETSAAADEELTELHEHPELPHSLRRRAWARTKKLLAGPTIERLGVPAVLLSGAVGIPPFAVVAAVAGAGRMKWWLFASAGLAGRFVRFLVVYEGAARTIGH